MVFNSYEFLLFFPIVVGVYHLIPQNMRRIWLLAMSYYFYMSWNAKYAVLIVISTVATYLAGILIDKLRDESVEKYAKAKFILVASLLINLTILFFFKYYGFFSENISRVLALMGTSLTVPAFDVVLPVGISFYTFQALGYCIDVYRKEVSAEKNLIQYALFVSFFPQLVAGPIERSGNLLHQLRTNRPVSYDQLRNGTLLMLWGLFQKIVIADRIAIFVDKVYGDISTYPGAYLVVASVLFAFQIYCDFGGYSNIAKGAAEILGIELMNNFNAPYFSTSCAEFWKRWHISLSSWFKDYLYIPLGGNRKGRRRKHFNIMVVFGLSGLWHGANWTYIIWGLLNGLFQIIGDVLRPFKKKLYFIAHFNAESIGGHIANAIVTFILIDFTWVFFRAKDLTQVVDMLRSIVTDINPWVLLDDSIFDCGLSGKQFLLLGLSLTLLFLVDLANYNGIIIRQKILEQEYWLRSLVFALSICAILVFGIWGTGYESDAFLYFQF